MSLAHEADVAVDAFSINKNLRLTMGEESGNSVADVKIYSERISGLAASKGKLDYTCQLKAAALPEAEFSYIKESGAVEGSVSAQLIYEQDEQIKSTQINLPFAILLNGAVAEGQSVEVSLAVGGVNVRQRAEGEIEAEAVVKIVATISGGNYCNYLKEIEEDGDVQQNDSALSVYIPAKGDGLWDIAKKLKSAPADVLACNPQLSYPLSGKERILIYRQSSDA
jgi:hypothetical protein